MQNKGRLRMNLDTLWKIVRKLDYTLSDTDVTDIAQDCLNKVQTESYNFATVNRELFTQGKKKRDIYSFDTLSAENIICHYIKRQVDKVFKIKYASRSKIINGLFNTLPVIKDMNDFVIIRADFKSFFDSVLTKHVYDKYIRCSMLPRGDKDILEQYISQFKYCYAGLCMSNGMTEIVCRDFDKHMRAKLEKYGVFFYERYVDDMLIMLNSYIPKDAFIEIAEETIAEVFGECPVRLNKSNDKFSYVSMRNIQPTQTFNFLGYEFKILVNAGKLSFEYGIAEKKRKKYENIIERAFINYRDTGNEELLRQRIKLFSSRVVIARALVNTSFDWLTKGIVANYNELQFHTDAMIAETEYFLQRLYYDLLRKHNLKRPYFIPKVDTECSIYNLYHNMGRNRTLVFEKNIGIPEETILRWIRKIDPLYSEVGKDYYRIVIEYLELLKIE